jgi:hypothetical protein
MQLTNAKKVVEFKFSAIMVQDAFAVRINEPKAICELVQMTMTRIADMGAPRE